MQEMKISSFQNIYIWYTKGIGTKHPHTREVFDMKKVFHRSLSLVLTLVMALTLAVPALAAPPTGISVDPQSASLTVGQSLTLTATVSPEDADTDNLIWTSSAPEVASVSPEGVVTALAVGTAYIKYHPDGQNTPAGICIIA